MKTSLFDFELPESLIAAHPASPRDVAHMLVVGDYLQDKTIRDLPSFLRPGDVMVFNDTKVIPARLLGSRGAAKIEVLLHKALSLPLSRLRVRGEIWQCFAKPAKKLKIGDVIAFAGDFHAEVMEKLPSGEVLLRFFTPSPAQGEGWGGGYERKETDIPPTLILPLKGEGDFYSQLQRYGHMPLPPYIEKKRAADASDQTHYQTVYARHAGSVAAPTAGLHFTPELLAAIDAMGVTRAHVTLHVGGGTFLPVKAEDTDAHVMHSEYAQLSAQTADIINHAKANGGRVIAVGTTSLRTLESAVDENGHIRPFAADTAIFITPGYRFRAADMLLTNFHLPRSTLFMLVSAFCGLARMQAAYAHAIAQRYRFYSYGDACLLYKDSGK